MKKYWMMMIVALCLPILASCGGNQSRENVETSTTATTSAKEVQKDIATKSNSEASISSSKTAPSTTVERENDTGQDLYKEVLERYKRYVSLLNQGKREADFSAEEFFHNFARIWRMKGRPELMKLMASVDVHAPAKLRVNVQVPNFDDFFTTYDVKEGDGMWRAPEDRVIIW